MGAAVAAQEREVSQTGPPELFLGDAEPHTFKKKLFGGQEEKNLIVKRKRTHQAKDCSPQILERVCCGPL